MRTTLIPVTVDTFETRPRYIGSKSDDRYEEGSFQASKTMTVTRMATPRGPKHSGGPVGAGVGPMYWGPPLRETVCRRNLAAHCASLPWELQI